MITKFKTKYKKQKKVKLYNHSFRHLNFLLKIISLSCISGILLISNLPMFSAFEAHIVNVTSQICYKEGKTRTIGYWKTHQEITQKYLPISVGHSMISTFPEAVDVLEFSRNANSMKNKMRAQLFATKINIAHYSLNEYYIRKNSDLILFTIEDLRNSNKNLQAQWIEDYFESSDEIVLAEIINYADSMLLGTYNDYELEAMMKILDNFNNLHDNLNYCAPLPIFINEIYANPVGDDNKIMPQGEWVELYNNSDSEINVDGWYLYNSYDYQPISISFQNGDNNNNAEDAGETIVPPYGWLVVYINGMHAHEWMQNDGDKIRLYDCNLNQGKLVSYYSYNSIVLEDKSIAKFPDGIGQWYDLTPTPAQPNILEKITGIVAIDSEDSITSSDAIEEISPPTVDVPETNPLSPENIIEPQPDVNPEVTSNDVLPLYEEEIVNSEIIETDPIPDETNEIINESNIQTTNQDQFQDEISVPEKSISETAETTDIEQIIPNFAVIDIKNENMIDDNVTISNDADELENEAYMSMKKIIPNNPLVNHNSLDIKNESIIDDKLSSLEKTVQENINASETLTDSPAREVPIRTDENSFQEIDIPNQKKQTENNEISSLIEKNLNESTIDNNSFEIVTEELIGTDDNSEIQPDTDSTLIQFNINI